MIKIITISREFGSGGRTIGNEVAKQLKIPCYDKELIEKTAEETGYAKKFIADEGEYAPNTNQFSYMFLGRGFDGLSNADKIRRQNYHLSIDSGFLGIEKAVALIVDAAGGVMDHA